MSDKAQTISKLRRLAEGQGHEADTARTILRELQKLYPEAAAQADVDDEPTTEHWFGQKNWHERQLLVALAYYLGCEPLRPKNRPNAGVLLRGPRSLIGAAPAIYKTLSKRLADLHRGTTVGFLSGARPYDGTEESSKKPDKLSDDALAAARTAMAIGRGAQPRKTLSSA